jgi:isoaspartyl peptidase/L-asparaginase-like protein (Ntn-hydrolase superfamily)
MISRRNFFGYSALASIGAYLGLNSCQKSKTPGIYNGPANKPVVISTWDHGIKANEAAWEVLNSGGRALDAVEKGVRVSEADPDVTSVGYGGLPDRDGIVTLDACIMDEFGNCGSVAFLENIMHPISVARLVMEKTSHVMLAGDGAKQFALKNGVMTQNLLTERSKNAWQRWIETNQYVPDISTVENHDTIGMLALDKNGNLSGACTTSGLAWKMHGRVGDSPIIGAGMYCDNEVGAAAATGKGEAVIKICGSFLIVELMRQGFTPKEACIEAVRRIVRGQKDYKNFQVGFIALNKQGETGAYSINTGFQYALYEKGKNQLIDSEYLVHW